MMFSSSDATMDEDEKPSNEKRIQRYREILKNASELLNNKSYRTEDLQLVREFWREQDECLREAQRTGKNNMSMQESILDLQIMSSTGSYIGQHIRELQTNVVQFNPSEFAEKLMKKFSVGGEMEWSQMYKDAVRIINRAPGIPTLLGTFSPSEIQKAPEEPKKRTSVRVSKDKEALATKQVAGKVENVTEDKNSVDKKVSYISKILIERFRLNNNRPISFYGFILHPNSFTATVENIFYISFIIRDGLASLDVTENDELVIFPLKKEGKKENTISTKQQMVFSITMQEWRDLVHEFGIKEPSIK